MLHRPFKHGVRVIVRPQAGLHQGTHLTKPLDHGGLNLSRFTSSYVIAAFMVVCILLTARKSEDDAASQLKA